MDPSPANKATAARLLRDFVSLRSRTAQQTITAAQEAVKAAAGGGAGVADGGSALQERPEMMLPYTIYILAHHPDFPEVSLALSCGGFVLTNRQSFEVRA